MNAARIHTATPASPKHRLGAMWFASIAGATEGRDEGIELVASLRRSVEFYSIYTETGDERYLGLCEDFLRDALCR